MHYIWLGLIILVVIIDLETSNILMSWMSFAFLAAFIMGFYDVPIITQIMVASVSSIPLLFIGNHISRKFIKTKIEPYKIGPEKLIGKTFHCEEDFDFESKHQINGAYWKIESEEPIKKGELMEILSMEGNKLLVKKINKEKE